MSLASCLLGVLPQAENNNTSELSHAPWAYCTWLTISLALPNDSTIC